MTRILLDTHALIWWWDESNRLTRKAFEAMGDGSNEVFASAVCGIEIGILVRLGRLPEMAAYADRYSELVVAHGFSHLPVSPDHAIRGGLMPGEHRDPFDRLIAAQALIEDLTVVTRDPAIAGFDCKVLW